MGPTPPRAGLLGSVASEVSRIESEQVKCSELVFATTSGRFLSFLSFARKKFNPLPALFYSIISHDPSPEQQGSEEAAPGSLPRWQVEDTSTALYPVSFQGLRADMATKAMRTSWPQRWGSTWVPPLTSLPPGAILQLAIPRSSGSQPGLLSGDRPRSSRIHEGPAGTPQPLEVAARCLQCEAPAGTGLHCPGPALAIPGEAEDVPAMIIH